MTIFKINVRHLVSQSDERRIFSNIKESSADIEPPITVEPERSDYILRQERIQRKKQLDSTKIPSHRFCCLRGPLKTLYKSGLKWGRNRDVIIKEMERLARVFPEYE